MTTPEQQTMVETMVGKNYLEQLDLHLALVVYGRDEFMQEVDEPKASFDDFLAANNVYKCWHDNTLHDSKDGSYYEHFLWLARVEDTAYGAGFPGTPGQVWLCSEHADPYSLPPVTEPEPALPMVRSPYAETMIGQSWLEASTLWLSNLATVWAEPLIEAGIRFCHHDMVMHRVEDGGEWIWPAEQDDIDEYWSKIGNDILRSVNIRWYCNEHQPSEKWVPLALPTGAEPTAFDLVSLPNVDNWPTDD